MPHIFLAPLRSELWIPFAAACALLVALGSVGVSGYYKYVGTGATGHPVDFLAPTRCPDCGGVPEEVEHPKWRCMDCRRPITAIR